jgi:hypothetical protein
MHSKPIGPAGSVAKQLISGQLIAPEESLESRSANSTGTRLWIYLVPTLLLLTQCTPSILENNIFLF